MTRFVPKQLSEQANADYLGVPGEIVTVPGVGIALHNGATKGGDIVRFPAITSGKNILRNSRFLVAQNGSSWVGIPTVGDFHYIADGWFFQRGGGGGSTANIAVSDTYRDGEDDIINALRVTTFSGGGSDAFSLVSQRFSDVRLLSGRVVTLSFKAKCNVARRMAVEFGQMMNGSSPNRIIAVGQAELDTTWKRFEFTFTVPELPDPYGIGANNHNYIYLWIEAGDNYNTRTGGITPFSGQTDITNLQLEIGDRATELEFLSYYDELKKVQEYYEKFSGTVSMKKEGLQGASDTVGCYMKS